jgi:AcrR family transcriptional regulator
VERSRLDVTTGSTAAEGKAARESREANGKPGRPSRLTGAQRQRLILDAAADLFAERGYERARLEEIASAAGVSKALIYEHFEGKRELYAQIMRKGTDESLGLVLAAAAAGNDSLGRLEAGLGAFLDFVADQPSVWRVIEQEVSDPKIIALDQSREKRGVKAVAALLASDPEIARQNLGHKELELLAVMINGATVRASNWWLENPDVERDAVLGQLIEFMWLGIERIRARGSYDED